MTFIPTYGRIVSLLNNAAVTTGSATTCTPTSDVTGLYSFTTSATGTITIAAPTGTPMEGQKLIIRFKASAAAITYSWNTAYRAGAVSLPSTSSNNKWDYFGFAYNNVDTKWDLIAVNQGF